MTTPCNYLVSENELLKAIDFGANRVAQINLLGGNLDAQLRESGDLQRVLSFSLNSKMFLDRIHQTI